MQIERRERRVGKRGMSSSAIALGCYSMSHAYGTRSDSESITVIRRAIDAGVNLFDTADFYGWGHNEELIGKALGSRRDEVLLSSKFGYVRGETTPIALCSTPSHVKQACEASLRRLGTDHLDILFQHRLDPAVPIEDTVGAMADLVREGKVLELGLCEVSANTLRRACGAHRIAAVQAEYSLWTREVEDLLPVLEELGVTLMAFSPLARGMLTGKLRSLDQLEATDTRRVLPRFSATNFPKNLALVDRLETIALERRCTVSQLALAWVLANAPKAIAICGADTMPFLEENLGALQVRLEAEEIEQIGTLFGRGRIAGDRYGPEIMKMLDRS